MSESLPKLRAKIKEEARFIDVRPYSHNLVSMMLRQMAKAFGRRAANQAIRDFRLKRKGYSEEPEDE